MTSHELLFQGNSVDSKKGDVFLQRMWKQARGMHTADRASRQNWTTGTGDGAMTDAIEGTIKETIRAEKVDSNMTLV